MAAVLKRDNHTPEFKAALTRLTLRNDAVFFIAMLYSLKHERHDPLVIRGMRVHAATDGATILYDGEQFSAEPLEERMFTLVHEILHVAYYHSLRRGIREPNLWNIAADYVVNGLIKDMDAFKIPANVIQPDKAFQGLSVEQVYDLLFKEAEDALSGGKDEGQGKNGRRWVRVPAPEDGSGSGIPGYAIEGHNPADVKDYDPAANESKSAEQVEREIGVATEKAMATAKAAGQGAILQKLNLRDAQVRPEPWFTHLRRFMNATSEKLYNWAILNRRRAALFNIVAPDQRSQSLEEIVLTYDESGSMTDAQMAAIGAHSLSIFKECRPKRVVVIRHTDRVTDVETFEGPDYIGFKLERKSSGGTDFRPMFDYIHAHHPSAQVILAFTDMYGAFPEGSYIPTLWVTSTPEKDVPTPFGERIAADFND